MHSYPVQTLKMTSIPMAAIKNKVFLPSLSTKKTEKMTETSHDQI